MNRVSSIVVAFLSGGSPAASRSRYEASRETVCGCVETTLPPAWV